VDVGFGFDREREPEILDSAPEGRRSRSREDRLRRREAPSGRGAQAGQGLGTRLVRGWGTWLSGQNVPSAGGMRSRLRWGRARLRRVPRWAAVATAAAVLAAGTTALAVGHERRPGPAFRVHLTGPAPQVVGPGLVVPLACYQLVTTTSSELPPGYRLELGSFALPHPAQASPPVPHESGGRTWPYLEKTAFVFRASGPPSTISIPAGWQKSVALGTPDGPSSLLHLPSCQEGAQWNVYFSAFYLRHPTGCVPLQIQSGPHTTTVRFVLGRRGCGR
jgi:hypothetical protein